MSVCIVEDIPEWLTMGKVSYTGNKDWSSTTCTLSGCTAGGTLPCRPWYTDGLRSSSLNIDGRSTNFSDTYAAGVVPVGSALVLPCEERVFGSRSKKHCRRGHNKTSANCTVEDRRRRRGLQSNPAPRCVHNSPDAFAREPGTGYLPENPIGN